MRAAFSLLLAAVFAVLGALPAQAQHYPRASGVQPLDQILPAIRRAHPGRFYDADGPTPGPDGSEHYHLKWMTPDGRIEWLDTDARTGRVLGVSPGRDNFDPPDEMRNYAPAPSYRAPPGFSERFRGGHDYGHGGYPGSRAGGYGGGGNYGRSGRGHGR